MSARMLWKIYFGSMLINSSSAGSIQHVNESSILDIHLSVHYYIQVDVQSASGLRSFRYLAGYPIVSVFYTPSASVQLDVICCPHVQPQSVLIIQERR